jgi:hypothetical protein
MDDAATLAGRHAASQRAFYAALTPAKPGGSVLTLDGGVQAAIAPAVRSRSLFNAVVYEDPDALLRVRDGLDEAYAAAGIEAWTVWVRPGDAPVGDALQAAGHRLDGRPQLMGGELAQAAAQRPRVRQPGAAEQRGQEGLVEGVQVLGAPAATPSQHQPGQRQRRHPALGAVEMALQAQRPRVGAQLREGARFVGSGSRDASGTLAMRIDLLVGVSAAPRLCDPHAICNAN